MISVPSARHTVEGQLLFPPFTQLGWDQNAPALEKVRPEEVAKAGHIIQYGRPLCVLSISGFVLLRPLTDSQMGLTDGGTGDGLLPRTDPPARQTEVVWKGGVRS